MDEATAKSPSSQPRSSIKPVSSFRFNIEQGLKHKDTLRLKIEAIEMQISEISKRAMLDNKRIIEPILQISSDPKEIALLGKCLTRIASMLTDYNTFKQQEGFIEFAERSPNQLANLFGDFESDVESFISQALGDTSNG